MVQPKKGAGATPRIHSTCISEVSATKAVGRRFDTRVIGN
jgi:hypothetical protein